MPRWKILAMTTLTAMAVAATAVLPVSAREPQALATATPEQVGMSAERLGRITTMLKTEIGGWHPKLAATAPGALSVRLESAGRNVL